MPSTQEFRRRIKSVNNTKQITKAMQMIASIKMQKAIKNADQLRSYVQNSWNMLVTLAKLTSPESHPLLLPKESNKQAIILVTSDRGLAGAFNSDVIRKLTNTIKPSNSEFSLANTDIIAIGKKGAEYVKRYSLGNLIAEFPFADEIQYEEIMPVAKLAIDEYEKGNYSKISIIYSHFESSLKQTPVVKQVLPITSEHIDIPELWQKKEEEFEPEFKFEPDADAVLAVILPQFVRVQIFGGVIEANASEHSARMVAMKNATDNAGDLIDELQLVYNTVRQGNITREIAEISGAAEAMK